MIVTKRMADEAIALLLPYHGDDVATAHPLTAEIVKGMYRNAARLLHPDKGGDGAAFAAVDRAKHILLKWLETSELKPAEKPHGGVTKCPRCNGVGYLELRRGFAAPLRKQCPTCQGNGETYDEREKDGDRL